VTSGHLVHFSAFFCLPSSIRASLHFTVLTLPSSIHHHVASKQTLRCISIACCAFDIVVAQLQTGNMVEARTPLLVISLSSGSNSNSNNNTSLSCPSPLNLPCTHKTMRSLCTESIHANCTFPFPVPRCARSAASGLCPPSAPLPIPSPSSCHSHSWPPVPVPVPLPCLALLYLYTPLSSSHCHCGRLIQGMQTRSEEGWNATWTTKEGGVR